MISTGPPPKISLLVWNLSTNDGAIRASLLGEALRRLGCQVEILGFLFGESVYSALPKDFPIRTIKGDRYPGFVKSIAQLLRQIDGDILYAIKPQPGSFGVALLKKWQTRRPLILDIDDWELSWHGGDEFKYHWQPKQFLRDVLKPEGALRRPDHPLYLQWMERLIYQADAVTVHTRFLKERFGGVFVPNGKDVDLFSPDRYDSQALKERYGLTSYRTLMFPGAPRPYKGLEDLLAALKLINEPDLKLVIVGGNPYDNYDEQLLREWQPWILQLPRQPADRMPEVVAAADVIVVPQRDSLATRAQFPLKLTDGMAMAKPVLATRVGDIPEILGDAGYLADPSSPEQLAEQIRWIFSHPEEAKEKGKQARIRCVEYCSIDTMASTLSTLLAQLHDSSHCDR
ncbi:MAG: glycosyltransferase family 4 protein [Leptolyngbyaceae cyanobacterium bins.59]|nr:glycosyltransferase family 4 protein [Leptolyngbyaceae cyanobacterium bins.59]